MAIPGQQVIKVGLPNESANSDPLYTAFNKINNNFTNLFGNASPFDIVTANTGISVNANTIAGTLDIKNTGVTKIIAGSGIIVNPINGTGDVEITSTGGGGGGSGTVTSVNVKSDTSSVLSVTGTLPITTSGTITIDMLPSGITAGTYTYPTVTVDTYGRVTSISNAASVGTVTSVGIAPGVGIQVINSPITTSGTITITNTGVTRLSAGAGISLSGSNGNVTISTVTTGGTVTSIGVSSSTLTVSGSPIVNAGTISVELVNLPTTLGGTNTTINGNILIATSKMKMTGGTNGYYLQTDGTGNLTWTAGTTTPPTFGAGGSNTEIQFNDSSAPNGAAGFTFDKTSNLFSAPGDVVAVANVTAGNLVTGGELSVTGNANIGNIGTGGLIIATGNITGGNLVTSGSLSVTSNANIGNIGTGGLFIATGNITGGNLITSGDLFLSGSENLVSGGAVNLTVTASYFSTSGASTATLAAGATGQIKTFMMIADSGDMVITVSNAGWKSSGTGTITFDDIGDGCTLQYINSKWFCIGQNGVTFG